MLPDSAELTAAQASNIIPTGGKNNGKIRKTEGCHES
jgi:hypothetical protein